jgi:exportin-2 (importin alpha re-exporter)
MLKIYLFFRMFGMVIERVFITDLQKVSGEIERKITAIGISNVLTNCSSMLENPYVAYYPQLLASLIEFFELPHDETQLPEDQQGLEMDDMIGYQAAYSQLIFASKQKRDPLACELI